MFNKNNPYNDELEISVEYDFTEINEKKETAQTRTIFSNLIEPTNELFERIDEYIKKYTIENRVVLSLKYNKNGTLVWSNDDYEFRSFLAVRFPIFFLESRSIDLLKWDSLWELIGTIAPFRQRVDINERIQGIFVDEDPITNNYQGVLTSILKIFNTNGIRLQKSTVYQKISQIVKLQLGGSEFSYDSHPLSTGSNGMNSFTYMKIYVDLILILFEDKYFSSALIMIDEPELHLHLKKIEDFVKSIKENKGYETTKWIFSTHSPTFAKNIIIENHNYNIFHITNNQFYNSTTITKINGFKQKKYKLISDNEANMFFSEACLFVEGDTELELFKNNRLVEIFPSILRYDIYSFEGKNDKLQLVNPNDRKSKIKYLVLLDMDKILSYVTKKNKFSISGSSYVNALKNDDIQKQEQYMYKDKFKNSFKLRKEIKNIIKNSTFTIDSSGLCLEEENERIDLIEMIQRYFCQYNLFPLQTTIEGAIITKENHHLIYQWLNTFITKKDLLKKLYSGLNTDVQKTNLLKVLLFGKTDWLNTESDSEDQNVIFYKILEKIKVIRKSLKTSSAIIDGKTSGWISIFLEWVYINKINPTGKNDKYKMRHEFQTLFPELGKVLVYLEDLV